MRLSIRLAEAAIWTALAIAPAWSEEKEDSAVLDKKIQVLEKRLKSIREQLAALRPLQKEYQEEQAALKEYDELGGYPGPIESSHRPVTAQTPLVVGQILQAQQADGTWLAARIAQLLPDGKVRVHNIGIVGYPGDILPRNKLQLDADALAKAKKSAVPGDGYSDAFRDGRLSAADAAVLVKSLGSKESRVRWKAAVRFRGFGSIAWPALPELARACLDEDAEIRGAAIVSLGEWMSTTGRYMPTDSAAAVLGSNLSNADTAVRGRAMIALNSLFSDSDQTSTLSMSEALMNTIKNQDAATKGLMALAFARDVSEIADGVPIVLRASEGPSGIETAQISLIFDEEKIYQRVQTALERLLDSHDPVIRRSAILFLHMEPDEAASRLGPLLTGDPDPLIRRSVALVLTSRTLLVKALAHDADERVRCAAADAVLSMPLKISTVMGALHDSSPRIQFRAMLALREMVVEKVVIEDKANNQPPETHFLPGNAENRKLVLHRLADEPIAAVRGLLAMALGENQHADYAAVVPLMLTALKQEVREPLPGRRSLQDQILGEFGHLGPAAVPAVEELLRQVAEIDGRIDEVRTPNREEVETSSARRAKVVFSALVRIGRGALPELTAALKSQNPTVRTTAAMVLAHLDPMSDAALLVLVSGLNSPCWNLSPDDPWLAEFSEEIWRYENKLGQQTPLRADEWALLNIGPRAVPWLVNRDCQRENDYGCLTVLTLMPQSGREAVRYLIHALKHRDESARTRAAEVLQGLGSAAADAIPALGEAEGDPASSVRRAAQRSRAIILAQIQSEKQRADDERKAADKDRPPGTVEVSADTPLKVNDAVRIEQYGHWYTGKVLELLGKDSIKVHYEGWNPRTDEVVPRWRLRRPADSSKPLPAAKASDENPFG